MNKDFEKIFNESWLPFFKEAREDRAFNYQPPTQLENAVKFNLGNKAVKDPAKALSSILRSVTKYSPKADHPGFLNYLYSEPDTIGLIGDWLVSFINSNVHTYEASPVFARAEVEMTKTLSKIVGFSEDSDGIFCPGGSYSNMLAMYLARQRFVGNKPMPRKLAVFTSEQSHYSVDKAAALLGIEKRCVHKVRADEKGKMIIEDLEKQIKAAVRSSEKPFFINATAGTTVLGGFDNLVEIRNILKKHKKVWLHVDAAWGGPAFFDKKNKRLMKGSEDVDSLTWDFHKLLGAPILCSALLVKDGRALKNAFAVKDSYLFHDDPETEDYELGRKSPQCGRRGDAFKLWLMWKIRGKEYFTKRTEKAFSNARSAINLVKKREGFLLYDENPEYLNVCFWCLPKKLRNIKSIDDCTVAQKKQIAKHTEKVYKCLKNDGQVYVNYAKVGNLPPFLRLITGNPNLNRENLIRVLDIIESVNMVLTMNLEELLISGGDERLELDENGMNYTFTAPTPAPKQVARCSCTSSRISVKEYQRLEELLRSVKNCELSFSDAMEDVHDRIKKILKIGKGFSTITIPSGTDAEYIPLLLAQKLAGKKGKVINIITGAGEVGSKSATAAGGLYFKSRTPARTAGKEDKSLPGMENVKVIEISQRDSKTGKPEPRTEKWMREVEKNLQQKNNFVLLHILESSKLGYRLDAMKEVKEVIRKHDGRILVAVDACQSRTDIERTREYLKMGCMVMITGSKFEEGPPFSGAVIIPNKITNDFSERDFAKFPVGLKDFITKHDLSGPISPMIQKHLPGWMNWGLMLRWTAALDNWQNYREVESQVRPAVIQDWAKSVLGYISKYPNFQVLGGGEKQPGSVGDVNTIISIKLKSGGKYLGKDDLRLIYQWMTEDVSKFVPKKARLNSDQKSVLRRSFLMGQPVELKKFAVLRIALGARLVCRMSKAGLERELSDDRALLKKLSILLKHFKELKKRSNDKLA